MQINIKLSIYDILKIKFSISQQKTQTIRFPFNQKTTTGFIVGAVIQIISGWKFCLVFCAICTFYIGVCWYVEAMFDHIKMIFHRIDSYIEQTETDDFTACESHMAKLMIKKCLLEAHDYHNQILRYSLNICLRFHICATSINILFEINRFVGHFAEIMDGVIFITFSIGIIWLSTSLTQYTVHVLCIFIA